MAKKKAKIPKDYDEVARGIVRIVVSIIELFGWPGALVGFIMWFIVKYGSPDQKERIIELYILGNGISNVWALVIISGTAILIILAQRYWYNKKMEKFTAEMDRIGNEKSDLQEKLAGQSLRHANSSSKKGR